MHSGKCLEPSANAPFENGDLVVQRTCDGSSAQVWLAIPLTTKTFVRHGSGGLTHTGYILFNQFSHLCLDDRDGDSSDGAFVQQWACTSSTTMLWGAFDDINGNNVIANLRASNNRNDLITLAIAGGSTVDNAPLQLFAEDASPPPPGQEWVFVER